MASLTYSVSLGTLQKALTRTGDSAIDLEVPLPVGKTVTSWVKTDANTAACNLPSGHGYTDGKFDVYWDGGYRYGVDGTISTNALSLDGGSGTDFPASATTGIVCVKQVTINQAIDGDNVAIIGIVLDMATADGEGTRVTFFDAINAGGSAVGAGMLLTANVPRIFDVTGGDTNELTGNPILSMVASNSSAAYAATLKIQGVQDVTP